MVVFNNGPRKGGEPDSIAAMRSSPSVQAIFRVHRNVREGALNTTPARIANMEEECSGEYVHMTVAPKGESYSVSVPSTGYREHYRTRPR